MVFRVNVSFEAAQPLQRGDRYMNTFHYTEGVGEPSFTALMDAVRDFYITSPDGSSVAVHDHLSPAISRAAGACLTEVYDLNDPAPRTTVALQAWTMPAETTSNLQPGEVACVLSHRAAIVGGHNRQRFRGRTYVGPLAQNATVPGTGLFADQVIDVIGLAAVEFLLEGPEGWELVVYSAGARDNSNQSIPYEDRPLLPPLASPVVRFEVDNAPDTMRSRGRAPTVRNEYD